MKIQEEEFNKAVAKLSQASLSSDQKSSMLKHIYTATANPRPDSEAGMIKSPWSFSFIATHRYAAACAVVLMLFGTTTYASTQSLPGDVLYNFKIKVVEPLALSAHWDEDSREEYKVSRLQERIKELRALRESGRIDSESSFASYTATQKNVVDLETSAVFNQEGKNQEVSTYINSYNSIAEEEFQVKTVIDLDGSDNGEEKESENAATTSVEVEVELPKEVTGAVDGTVEETTDIVKEAERVVEPLIEDAEDTIEPVEEITGSLTKNPSPISPQE